MSKTNDELAREIAEEDKRASSGKDRQIKISNSQITGANIAWMLGAFAVDLTTSYAIWQILFWWYGVAWIIAGAGGIVYTNWLRERVGNNDEQKEIAETGLTLSWIAIVIMAVFSGSALAFGMTKNPYIEGFTILFVSGLFLYHVFQSYRYSIKDDDYIETTKEARANEQANKRVRAIHRAARIVEARKREDMILDEYVSQHGAAIIAALGKQTEQTNVFAQDVDGTPSLQTVNPTQADASKRPQK